MKPDDDILVLSQKSSDGSDEPLILTKKITTTVESDTLKDLIAQVAPPPRTEATALSSAYDFLENNSSPAFRSLLKNTVAQFLEDRWGDRLDKLVEECVEQAVEKEITRLRILLSKEIGTLPEDL